MIQYIENRRVKSYNTYLWHCVVRIENNSKLPRYLKNIDHLFELKKGVHEGSLASGQFSDMKIRINAGESYQYSCQLSLFQPNMEMNMILSYRYGRRMENIIVKNVTFDAPK